MMVALLYLYALNYQDSVEVVNEAKYSGRADYLQSQPCIVVGSV